MTSGGNGGIMYNIGDQVVYCSHGVCTIRQIEERMIDKKTVYYYVLSPIASERTAFYVPVHNPVAQSKMRPLLTLEELKQIFSNPELFADCWIPEENRRKLRYKELLSRNDLFLQAQMAATLERRRNEQISCGKKFHLADESFLRDVRKSLESELSVILSVPASEVMRELEKLIQA